MSTMRRTTLGPISASVANSRASLGPAAARLSTAKPGVLPGMNAAAPRQSLMPNQNNPRRSSVFGMNNAGAVSKSVKDPRPTSDKSFMKQEIETLITYLSERGFDGQLTVKQLMSPSAKDYLTILTFLVQQIDPSFTFHQENWADEVMSVFKQLGYPITMNKKDMLSVGSPHSWPLLLAGLSWLVEVLSFVEKSNANEARREREDETNFLNDEVRAQKMFFDFICSSYSQFMNGVTDPEILNMDLVGQFKDSNEALKRDIEMYSTEVADFSARLDKYKSEPSPLSVARAKKQDFVDDIEKFKTLTTKLVQHKANLDRKVQEKETEIAVREQELKEVTEKKKELTRTLEQQDAAQIDASKIARERRSAHDSLKTVSEARETLQKQVWDKEMELASTIDSIEKKMQQFENLRSRLARFDEEASQPPMNLSLNIDSDTNTLGCDYRSVIKPALRRLKETLQQKNRESQISLRSAEEDSERAQERLNDKKEDVLSMEAKVERLDQQYKKEKEVIQNILKAMDDERSALEEEMASIRREALGSVTQSETNLSLREEEYKRTIDQCNAEKKAMNDMILALLDELTQHREHVQDVLATLPK